MRALAELLRHKDVIVDEAKSRRPGIVVYEDDHQVGIVPFGAYRRSRAT
jgi:hypothetical protein